ncbi:MAG: DUF2207 domain-containing protein [Chloroflexota bacterium]
MTKRPYLLLIGLSLFLLSFLTPQPTNAQAKTFFWQRWDSNITVLENGDLRIVEHQTLNFAGEPFTFGFRSILTGTDGNNEGIVDIEVREGDVVYQQANSRLPRTFTVSQNGNEVRVDWYFEPALGEHTYTFSYTVKQAVRVGTLEEGDGDQVFWTVIPDDHPARVQKSRVTLLLPQGIAPQQYFGTQDYLVEGYTAKSEDDSVVTTVEENGRLITYERTTALAVDDQFDVRVQFPHGLLRLEKPGWQSDVERSDAFGIGLMLIAMFLAVTGPLGVLVLWYSRGRDPQLDIIVPDYLSEPPDDLPPAVAGTLVDESADMSDIVSILVDLAQRGYLTMSEEKHTHRFRRTKKSDEDLRPFEKRFLIALFKTSESRRLKDLKYKFHQNLPRIREMLYEELVDRQLVPQSPEKVRSQYSGIGVLLFVLAAAGCFGPFFLSNVLGDSSALGICIGLSIGFTALLMLFAAQKMPRKTELGTEAAAKWRAFEEYLKNIEKYQDLKTAGDIFEKYLPYAVAFGIERRWINKFESLPTTHRPPWYIPYGHHYHPVYGHGRSGRGGGGGSRGGSGGGESSGGGGFQGMSDSVTGGLAGMSAGFTRMLNNTATTLKSTPPSASSGGSSGGFSGGFSGGSSGGGGSAGFG